MSSQLSGVQRMLSGGRAIIPISELVTSETLKAYNDQVDKDDSVVIFRGREFNENHPHIHPYFGEHAIDHLNEKMDPAEACRIFRQNPSEADSLNRVYRNFLEVQAKKARLQKSAVTNPPGKSGRGSSAGGGG
jgi:hypothetical protein